MTTSRKVGTAHHAEARLWAERLQTEVVPRADLSLPALLASAGATGVLVVGGDRVTYHEPRRELVYFFHPGMARRRLRNYTAGRGDPMLTAMRLQAGDTVLDCTLGRGTDATLAAHVAGPTGRVVGLEKMPVLAWMTIDGLQHYEIDDRLTREAMRRVEAHCADYAEALPRQETDSFEVVYFDPLFDQPVAGASGMVPLRQLASDEPVTVAALEEARRVARRCVVIKQRVGTPLWAQLPFPLTLVSGGKSNIEYGVIVAA
ncbi:MAG TPA: class I SAM-dependent methyltransferase [Armatimonadota bacterium]